MTMRDFGLNRAARRKGSNPQFGGSNADEHFRDLDGSSHLWIYLTPNKRLKRFDELKQRVESRGCWIGMADDAPVNPGKNYQQLKIAALPGTLIPRELLRFAHSWAHNHNFLHSFYRPDIRLRSPL